MALDLLFGPRKRNWARAPSQLLTAAVPGVVIEQPGEKALREAKELDSLVKVRPAAGRGAVVTAKLKWG
jgi:hypothetical protein